MWSILFISLVGFVAQLINGSLGMAFGVVTTSALLATSLSPAAASSVVHIAEIGTSAMNGTFHGRLGNVDLKVLLLVGIPGAVGAFTGALTLSKIDLTAGKPFVASVLLIMGALVLLRFVRREVVPARQRAPKPSWLLPLGLFGGFIDASGGGGWGTIVTSSLTASNTMSPRKSIGTSTTARLFVAIAGSVGFFIGLGFENIPWATVLALVVGALLAAPLGPWFVRRVPQRILGLLTGTLIIGLNLRQLLLWFESPPVFAIAIILVVGIAVVAALIFGFRLLRQERLARVRHEA